MRKWCDGSGVWFDSVIDCYRNRGVDGTVWHKLAKHVEPSVQQNHQRNKLNDVNVSVEIYTLSGQSRIFLILEYSLG